ncbi:MAG: MarR family winged helix-turn-helix transcriptional regulator [Deferrisomatales bacterium]
MPPSPPKSPHDELVLGAYIKLMRAAESVTARAHRHLAKAKLSFGQFAVLEVLYHLGTLCQKDIAAKVLKSPRNITMIVDNLEVRGLVRRERDASDRRFLYIHLTDEGRALFEKLLPRHVEHLRDEFEILSDDELAELGRLCRVVGKGRR